MRNGPYIQAACFCEMILEDKTGVLSLLRIIDTLNHSAQVSDLSEPMQPFTFVLKFVLMLKSGEARGRHMIKIVPELPSGELREPVTIPAHLNGEDSGQNVVADLAFEFTLEGLYWFNVYFDEELITALPIRIRYNPIVAAGAVHP